jgi:ferredoxin
MTLPRPLLWLLATAFRFFPLPTRPGLCPIGEPGSDSPVLLTGNFALTVDCVRQALEGLDAWLLVTNSRGINVWCAAAGGHLTTHDVISALKTTRVAERVDHRRVILPQLAATGVETDRVLERTGWESIWGPVYAEDLAGFLCGKETPEMREVHFNLRQRLEIAVMWAAPLSLLAVAATLLFWARGFLCLVALIWGLTLTVYGAFPVYEGLVRRGSLVGFSMLFGGLTEAGVVLVGALTSSLSLSFFLRWGGLGLAMVFLLGFDLAGSTPLFKSWSHEERGYRVELDAERCIVCGRCAQVCPRGVFVVADSASMPRAERCERCGACIVQCPADALAFVTPDGARVPPEDIRRCKLNLMGKRRSVSKSA